MKVTPIRKKFGKYAPGDVFELPSKTAKVLIKLGKLQAVEEGEPVPAPAVVEAAIVSEPEAAPARRTYQRRDMQAEGAPTRRAPAKKATAKRATRTTSKE